AIILERVQSSAIAQTSTSRAAAPDATQKRKCPTSGSIPSIAKSMRDDDVASPTTDYIASMAQCRHARQSPAARLVLDLELAFFCYALKGLARILDAILIIVAIGWQQSHNFVAATGAGPANRTRRVKYGLADVELMGMQRMSKRRHLRNGERRGFGSC